MKQPQHRCESHRLVAAIADSHTEGPRVPFGQFRLNRQPRILAQHGDHRTGTRCLARWPIEYGRIADLAALEEHGLRRVGGVGTQPDPDGLSRQQLRRYDQGRARLLPGVAPQGAVRLAVRRNLDRESPGTLLMEPGVDLERRLYLPPAAHREPIEDEAVRLGEAPAVVVEVVIPARQRPAAVAPER